MKKLIVLGCTFLLGLTFLAFKSIPYTLRDFFLFSDQQLTIQTWAYFLFEHLILIMLSWVIASEETKYKFAVTVFFYLQVWDTIDYVLTYNGVWFEIAGLPVSMNVFKVAIFAMAIIYDYFEN